MDSLVTIYGCLFFVGVIGNGTLAVNLYWGRGSKSPLLLGLIIADFFVCCLSGPITAATYSMPPDSPVLIVAAQYLQSFPVTASTLSMMVISVDRYFTVKNYRPIGQVATRRQVLSFTVAATWLSAAFLASFQIISRYKHPWRKGLTISRIALVHIIPAFTVMMSHLGVHAKLTALSLTARAKHGELPLPIPLMRRPTHVIIVAGMPKGRKQMSISSAQDEIEETPPPTSSLRSRRRLANCLLCLSLFFILCWFPYVVCQFCEEFMTGVTPEYVQQLTLFLGHMHSAIGPILYWSMNHKWPKGPCSRIRRLTIYRSASSTNEAALGPFNPRLVRPPPYRRRSSQYLY
ncbi:endothelin receptor type B isoform X1 [Diabrotica virgifera virgifera]|uniref:G-protein coupled receptors family 1 profile domain-containing protein n=3 Tax=Diabrotica virgifera virgifera TaxID=50390 RepID=A0ABM5JHN1_DIAVI|nr:endothelin receptor type B isoform X1 [Diabrotica virgifera virgifera]